MTLHLVPPPPRNPVADLTLRTATRDELRRRAAEGEHAAAAELIRRDGEEMPEAA